jgi:hypothetical protein
MLLPRPVHLSVARPTIQAGRLPSQARVRSPEGKRSKLGSQLTGGHSWRRPHHRLQRSLRAESCLGLRHLALPLVLQSHAIAA